MRLHLDPAVTGTGVTKAGDTGQAASVGSTGGDSSRVGSASASPDSIQISGASSALNRLAADRSARIEQLTALVQGGSYEAPAAQVSQAIVQGAVSGAA